MNTKLRLWPLIAALACIAFTARADVAPPPPTPEDTAANKALVIEMFQTLFDERRVDELADKYLTVDFIEHNPTAVNGTKGLRAFFKDYFAKNPKATFAVKRVIADGDLVLVHFHAQNGPEDRGVAGVDIFRLENGKVVEHWDVLQPIPEKSANNNTMF